MASPIVLDTVSTINQPITLAKGQHFRNNYGILAPYSMREKMAVRVLGLVHELNAVFDYRSKHAQLFSDASAWTGGISNIDLTAALAANEWLNGFAADGTITSDLTAILKEARDLSTLSEDELSRIIAFLRFYLAV